MKVVLLSKSDWANLSYFYEKSLNAVGIEAKAFSKTRHRYYPKQVKLYKNIKEIKEYIQDADVVMFVHSVYTETGVSLKNKIVCVVHTGSAYRQNSKKLNKIFNPIVDVTFSGGDVLGMGAKNEIWVQPAIDINKIQPSYFSAKSKDKAIIAHYPSGKKGYPIIKDVISRLKRKNFIFKYDSTNVPWENNLKRMSECDIYIETMNTEQNGIPLHVFGTTALEAAALGKIVCSRFPMFNEYEKTFGSCGLIPAYTPEILKDVLENLLSMSNLDFIALQKKSREWVVNCHSYKVIGEKFKTIFENIKRKK